MADTEQNNTETFDTPSDDTNLQRRDDAVFKREVEALIRQAEDMRLTYMQRYNTYNALTIWVGVMSALIGSGAFAWYFLIEFQFYFGLIWLIGGIVPLIALNIAGSGVMKSYTKQHKRDFMPKLAKILGNFRFYEERGISPKVLPHTGVLPSFNSYFSEDCFIGKYKGVKVIFSEARLFKGSSKGTPVFDGIFVLLETPEPVIEGHTIVTADHESVKKWQHTRWKKFSPVTPQVSDSRLLKRFQVFTDTPEAAELLVGEKLLKELAEASDIFDDSTLSMALFKKKYIFIAIPYENDMFEASDINYPITTHHHAMRCKKEIDQILEIIDVYDIYKVK